MKRLVVLGLVVVLAAVPVDVRYLASTPTAEATVRSLDGANDEVDMGNVLNVTTGDVSNCHWVNMGSDNAFDWISGKKETTGTGAGWRLSQASTDVASCNVADGTTELTSNSTTSIQSNWRSVCCTWDGTNDDQHLYVDGIEEDTDTSAGLGSLTNAFEYAVGESGDENTADGDGLVGPTHVFLRELRPAELTDLMYIPDGNGETLSGFWLMIGDSPEQDLSGSNFDGTVSNATTNAGGPPYMLGHQAPL